MCSDLGVEKMKIDNLTKLSIMSYICVSVASHKQHMFYRYIDKKKIS